MRRKPLFPPPHDPTTGKRLANKGRQSRAVLTINGQIKVVRRWWHRAPLGSVAPADAVLDRDGSTITPGVLEMACRVNLSATSFVRAAAALERTAQVKLSGERLRQVVESVGRRVLQSQQDNTIAVAWHAEDCTLPEEEASRHKFVYPGPRPFSKETAVLMMADSVEASSRSLRTKDEANLSSMVEEIINQQIREQQFDNTDITFRDIDLIKEIFLRKLLNIYHVRIEYPR